MHFRHFQVILSQGNVYAKIQQQWQWKLQNFKNSPKFSLGVIPFIYAINTEHVDWCHKSRPARFRKLSDVCVLCQLAKSKRRMFSSSQPVINVPGQHWYMDVWGPDETPSLLHMNVHTIGFRDSMSDAIWLYHSKTKDAVLVVVSKVRFLDLGPV